MTADPPTPADRPPAAGNLARAGSGVTPRGSLRADVLSGYALTACRLAAWAGVSAVVYRRAGPEAFAVLALLRGTVTLVGYAAVGLGPAMVRQLAEAGRRVTLSVLPVLPIDDRRDDVSAAANGSAGAVRLGYAAVPAEPRPTGSAEERTYWAGVSLAHRVLFRVAVGLAAAYALAAPAVHVVPDPLRVPAQLVVFFFGVGVASRLTGEPASAALQVRGRLALDNAILAGGEVAWLALAVATPGTPIAWVAFWWCVVARLVTTARHAAVRRLSPDLHQARGMVDWAIAGRLVRFGSALLVAQLADFLYAPTDYVLINRLLSPADVAVYAPAVQVDAALLLVVGALATTLFPHAAVAHAGRDFARLRRLYVRGTLASVAALLLAGGATLAFSPWLFRLWLGDDLPGTRALLSLVLIHTVVGGSSAAGRSVLLGMGKVRALTVSALVAGGANVALSAAFATFGGLGLRGIVLGTVVVVVARCALWMPWYVWRTLRAEGGSEGIDVRVSPS